MQYPNDAIVTARAPCGQGKTVRRGKSSNVKGLRVPDGQTLIR